MIHKNERKLMLIRYGYRSWMLKMNVMLYVYTKCGSGPAKYCSIFLQKELGLAVSGRYHSKINFNSVVLSKNEYI